MKWTRQLPTEPGYYWFRHGMRSAPLVVEVENINNRFVASDTAGYWLATAVASLPPGYWAGPIRPPA